MMRWFHSGGDPLFDVLAALAVLTLAALTMGGALVGLARWIQRLNPPDEPGEDADDRGGGNRRPDPPRPGGGSDPAWWPDFERDFEHYVATVDAARSSGTAKACALPPGPRRHTGDRRAFHSRRRRRRADACTYRR
jgi:hypothetical protein